MPETLEENLKLVKELHEAKRAPKAKIASAGHEIAEAYKAEGASVIFGVMGGHEWAWLDMLMRAGVKQITVRHEQAAGYAAEGYARTHSDRPGLAHCTVGPGLTNLFSAVHECHLTNTPIIVLTAGHESEHDDCYALQEMQAEKFCSPVTKFTKRLINPATYKRYVRKAFRESMEPPPGPVVLETECNALWGMQPYVGLPTQLYREDWIEEPIRRPGASPQDVGRAVKLIQSVDKVSLWAGDGVLWSQASPELVEFAELARIPTTGRRGARGSIPEVHPLSFKGGMGLAGSEMLVLIGARIDFYDMWGQAWGDKKIVQINRVLDFINPWFKTEYALQADPKMVLRQMIDYIKDSKIQPPAGREAWIKAVQEEEAKRYNAMLVKADRFKDYRKPLHGGYACKVIWDVIEKRYGGRSSVAFDSFTGANTLGPFMKARRAGQCLDSGPQAGVGHGVGLSIGAAVALREMGDNTPIFAMLGDAGVGLAGMDIETSVRHRLPIVWGIWNDDGWTGLTPAYFYGPNFEAIKGPEQTYPPMEFLPDIRYDKMFECMGAHGEWVDEPEQLAPALNRCFDAAEKGQPAVFNVDVIHDAPINTIWWTPFVNLMMKHVPWEEEPFRGRMMFRDTDPTSFFWGFDEANVPHLGKADLWEPLKPEEWFPYAPPKPREVPPWYEEAQKRIKEWK